MAKVKIKPPVEKSQSGVARIEDLTDLLSEHFAVEYGDFSSLIGALFSQKKPDAGFRDETQTLGGG